MLRWGLVLTAAALLAACSPKPAPANPALWRIDGPGGAHGWLFGTIHTLPRPLDWRTPRVAAALAGADRLVVEIADLGGTSDVFSALSQTPGQPPLASKVPEADRPALAALLRKGGIAPDRFATTETWAAALMLAQVASADATSEPHPEWGIDRALLAEHGTMAVGELEGARAQLGLFDGLPEDRQRRLLATVVEGAGSAAGDTRRLAEAWARGDMATIAGETTTGMLADPALKTVLFTRRNADWSGKIDAMLRAGTRPFVAVGAAHMAGPEGLPALLAARGWTITRVE